MSGIEWTDRTWNPTVGCSPVSPGCANCYAAAFAHRGLDPAHRGLTTTGPDGLRLDDPVGRGPAWTGQVRLLPDRLDDPLRWRKPARIFVGSMSDLFHPAVPDDFITEVFGVMSAAHWHTFQTLTKRPARMARWVSTWTGVASADGADTGGGMDPLPNVWLGTSIEADRYSWRADHLRATPAAVRWLSLEPLIGALPSLDLDGIDWVVVGGESGAGARPMHPAWVRDIRDRCSAARIPFLFKQWGSWAPAPPTGGRLRRAVWVDGSAWTEPYPQPPTTALPVAEMCRTGKTAAGRDLDGRSWHRFPDDADVEPVEVPHG